MGTAKRFLWVLAVVMLVSSVALADEEASPASDSSGDYRITSIEAVGGAPFGARRHSGPHVGWPATLRQRERCAVSCDRGRSPRAGEA